MLGALLQQWHSLYPYHVHIVLPHAQENSFGVAHGVVSALLAENITATLWCHHTKVPTTMDGLSHDCDGFLILWW
jgi:hypothetical protein